MGNRTRELCEISLKLPISFLANRIKAMLEMYQLHFVYFSGNLFILYSLKAIELLSTVVLQQMFIKIEQAPLGSEEKRVTEILQLLPQNIGLKYNDLLVYIKSNKPTLVNSTVDFRYRPSGYILVIKCISVWLSKIWHFDQMFFLAQVNRNGRK